MKTSLLTLSSILIMLPMLTTVSATGTYPFQAKSFMQGMTPFKSTRVDKDGVIHAVGLTADVTFNGDIVGLMPLLGYANVTENALMYPAGYDPEYPSGYAVVDISGFVRLQIAGTDKYEIAFKISATVIMTTTTVDDTIIPHISGTVVLKGVGHYEKITITGTMREDPEHPQSGTIWEGTATIR
jgi:hypothetical protein